MSSINKLLEALVKVQFRYHQRQLGLPKKEASEESNEIQNLLNNTNTNAISTMLRAKITEATKQNKTRKPTLEYLVHIFGVVHRFSQNTDNVDFKKIFQTELPELHTFIERLLNTNHGYTIPLNYNGQETTHFGLTRWSWWDNLTTLGQILKETLSPLLTDDFIKEITQTRSEIPHNRKVVTLKGPPALVMKRNHDIPTENLEKNTWRELSIWARGLYTGGCPGTFKPLEEESAPKPQ